MRLFQPANGPRLWRKILRRFPKGAIVAGGAVRDYLLGVSPKDIDVFFPSTPWPADGYPGFRPLEADRENEYAALTNIDIVQRGFIDGFQVDFVGVRPSESGFDPAALVQTFDFGIARCWFDGHSIHDTREAFLDRTNGTVSLLIQDRVQRAIERFERFNTRMGGTWRLVPDVRLGSVGELVL